MSISIYTISLTQQQSRRWCTFLHWLDGELNNSTITKCCLGKLFKKGNDFQLKSPYVMCLCQPVLTFYFNTMLCQTSHESKWLTYRAWSFTSCRFDLLNVTIYLYTMFFFCRWLNFNWTPNLIKCPIENHPKKQQIKTEPIKLKVTNGTASNSMTIKLDAFMKFSWHDEKYLTKKIVSMEKSKHYTMTTLRKKML